MTSSPQKGKVVGVALAVAVIAAPLTQAALNARHGTQHSKPVSALMAGGALLGVHACINHVVPVRCSFRIALTPELAKIGLPTPEALALYLRSVSAAGIYGNVPTVQYLTAIATLPTPPSSMSYEQAVAKAGIYGNVPTRQYLAVIALGR